MFLSCGLAVNDDIEDVACVALPDDDLAHLDSFFLDSISELRSLILAQSLQDFDVLENLLILLSLLGTGPLDDGVEGVTVQGIQHGLLFRDDGGSSRRVVQ